MVKMSSSRLTRIVALALAAIIILGTVAFLFSTMAHAIAHEKALSQARNISDGIKGVDVSKYQGNIDWNAVASDNIKFAMVRASYGMTPDEKFLQNARGADAAGIYVGAYHYARFSDWQSMRDEADYFLNQLSQVNITYPVVLDLEATRGLGSTTLTNLAVEFMDILRAKGYKVMLYTYNNFMIKYLQTHKLQQYHLWIANYLEEPVLNQHMWQYTSSGLVSGINAMVDLNIAYVDLAVRKGSNPEVSAAIHQMLNEVYSVSLTISEDQMPTYITACLQSHLKYRLGTELTFDGQYDDLTKEALHSVDFNDPAVDKQFIKLLQSMLYYKGYYDEIPTGELDENTEKAIKQIQIKNALGSTGTLDNATLDAIMAMDVIFA